MTSRASAALHAGPDAGPAINDLVADVTRENPKADEDVTGQPKMASQTREE
jgi:hypothetical protein